jgi:predicted nucleic acid-binding protein
MDCPGKPSILFREPAYLEQLIPVSELQEFGIKTRTPIKYKVTDEPQRLLEIEDNDKVIAAYLQARAIKVSRKGKENRLTIEEYAKENNMRLVYKV